LKVVEMLGVPGSGKSTLADALVADLPDAVDLEQGVLRAMRARGEDDIARFVARIARSPDSRLWKRAYARSTDRFSALTRFVGDHPDLLEAVLAAQRLRSDRDRDQDAVLGWVLNLMARYQVATESGGLGWLVVDEGFCQRGVALFGYGYHEEDRALLDSYLEAIPIPDVVIVVDTPLEDCRRRLEERGWSERLVGAGVEERNRFLTDSSTVVEAVSSAAAASGTRVIRVDGTAPTPDSYAAIAATLNP